MEHATRNNPGAALGRLSGGKWAGALLSDLDNADLVFVSRSARNPAVRYAAHKILEERFCRFTKRHRGGKRE